MRFVCGWLSVLLLAGAAASMRTSTPVSAATPQFEAGTVCLAQLTPGDLSRLFETEPGGVVGADYQRATTLPDGRIFWTLQDAAIRLGPDRIVIVHNIAMLQDGACFTILYGGSRNDPRPFFLPDRTRPFERWFWPLDSTIGEDGRLYVFLAEVEERSDEYLTHTVPIATRTVVVDPATAAVVAEVDPPNGSADLYGWSITSDDRWTYLYAQCYRQFGFDLYIYTLAFDRSCSTDVTVARVPRGRIADPMSYWDGRAWKPDPGRAVSIVGDEGRLINANQIEWTGAQFVSVNKVGDWWGATIEVSRSASPTGPFEVVEVVPAPLRCPSAECNSFFADWVPAAAAGRAPDQFVISLSHNRWSGEVSAQYRPSFHFVGAPTFLPGGRSFAIDVGTTGAAALNVTVVDPLAPGFVTVYPCGASVPGTSNVNHVDEPVVANLVLTRTDEDGRVCVYSRSTTNVVVDRAGTFGDLSGFEAIDPVRLLDTRIGLGAPQRRVAAGDEVEIAVDAGSSAVVLNVVAVDPDAPGYLTVFGCDRAPPATSNVNYVGEPVVANLVFVRPSADGRVCVRSLAATDVVVDLAGRFADGGTPGFRALDDAARLVDTRDGERLAAAGVLRVDVPPGDAVVLNVVAVDPAAPGFLSVYPCDRPVPNTSNVNFVHVPVVANLVIARPSADGAVCIRSTAETDVVVDLAGSFVESSGYVALDAPERLVDSRTGLGIPGELGVL